MDDDGLLTKAEFAELLERTELAVLPRPQQTVGTRPFFAP